MSRVLANLRVCAHSRARSHRGHGAAAAAATTRNSPRRRSATQQSKIVIERQLSTARASSVTDAHASMSFDDDEIELVASETSTSLSAGRKPWKDGEWLRGDARQVAELEASVVAPVNALEPKMLALSDEELRAKTDEFRARLKNGETLDDILVEAFAVVREASRRELGLRHFDVQLIGGVLLHRGWVAEMRTGEGKTLVATLPAYLNALEGKGVHVVTVNDYLAERDATEMGRIHRFLGVTVGVIQSAMDSIDRQLAYACDITYVTNTEVGFDYLRDNMAMDAEELVVLTRPFNFAIVDEVDSVLIDEGRNPLLITGSGGVSDEDRYVAASKVAQQLKPGRDYKVVLKEKTAELTEEGMELAERILKVKDLWDTREPWGKYILLAVKAKALFIKDVDYIVRDGQVIIVDPSTGRVQMNRRWNDNLHQAVEAKEGVEIQGENSIIASISYQCLFKLYQKLSGMTGTASTESEEFFSTYELRVARVPTNKPNLRVDAPTALFLTAEARWYAVADFIESCHYDGRPVLVGTTSVENSERLSAILDNYLWTTPDGRKMRGIPHELLNARPQYAAREANIIAQAGRQYAVTIATNMAGRGTDILLGGSSEGLAKHALMEKLWPVLGFADAFDDEAVLLSCDLSPIAQQSLEQAAILARAARAMAGDLDLEEAEKLIANALFDAAERLRRNMDGANACKDDSPFIRAIKVAAFAVLRDCSEQCNAERDVVRKLGGLQVIGTSIHESRRVDNQLRGRAGRQGDLGSTAFFVSSEDELLQTYCPGWGSDKLWMFAGVDPNMPIYSDTVDNQLEMVQKRIEDFFATHREATFESDRVLDGQREAVYKLRRLILLSGQQPLRERLFKYMGQIVDETCARAGVAGNVNPKKWNYVQLLDELRLFFPGRKDKWLCDIGRPLGKNPHYLPGVDAEQIMKAVVDRTPLPESTEMPPLKMPAAVVKAALSGIEMVYPEDQDFGPTILDTEPEATPEAISKRLAERLSPVPVDADEDPAYVSRWNKGWHAAKARRLRSYLTEAAIQLYLDRFARLAVQNYARDELEHVERLWALRAIDNLWQEHLVEMEVLRSSVQVRSFGHLDPRDEFRIDGARSFVALVDSIREEMIRNIFFFVGASAEPIVDFDAEETKNN